MSQLFLFLSFFNNADCRLIYLDKVFESQNMAKYFIVISVKVDNNEGDVVVSNKNLYNSLRRKDRRFTIFDNYCTIIKDKIVKNESIEFTKAKLTKMNTKLIEPDSSVLEWSDKGEEVFVKHYFEVYQEHNYATLKSDVHAQSIPTIVKVLFNWNYLITSVEGNLVIEQLDFCKKDSN
ncbi:MULTISPECIES: hypothetical protein [unclassified Paraflavitalea]|uniref:hypothetical protein n=1 Tax=unclassified Paraflavitalea TaxID=2798305 RepID=UPI003D351F11